mmetsp:Transcript_44598/g.117852  ORF Transcript_44598/g.117852 Transcript_44598/m.117852 type:complete len:227 (+) Transcript_44598:304-984(+)
MPPSPSRSNTRKAARKASSERSAPTFRAAASHSVYSISCEPSVSIESKTESTQSLTSPRAPPGAARAMDRDSSSLESLPLPSVSIARNSSRNPLSCWLVSCMASTVSAARRIFALRWKAENAFMVAPQSCSAGITASLGPLHTQGWAEASAAVMRRAGSGCRSLQSRSRAGCESLWYRGADRCSASSPKRTSEVGKQPTRRACSTMPVLQTSETGMWVPARASGAW